MTRVIRKSRARSSREAANLLGGIFTAELSDRARACGSYRHGSQTSRLSTTRRTASRPSGVSDPVPFGWSGVLVTLAGLGNNLVVGTTSGTTNNAFMQRTRRLLTIEA